MIYLPPLQYVFQTEALSASGKPTTDHRRISLHIRSLFPDIFFCFAYCPAILFLFEMQKVFQRFAHQGGNEQLHRQHQTQETEFCFSSSSI